MIRWQINFLLSQTPALKRICFIYALEIFSSEYAVGIKPKLNYRFAHHLLPMNTKLLAKPCERINATNFRYPLKFRHFL